MTNEEKAKRIALDKQSGKASGYIETYLTAYKSAMEMAEWKDKEIKEILLAYTKWLDKRGFFKEDLQCDFSHQIETFLEMKGDNK